MEEKTKIKESSFWQSINILIKKPHVVNKRLWGSKILCKFRLKVPINFEEILDHVKLKNDKVCPELTLMELITDWNIRIEEETGTEIEIILVELLPKNYGENHAFQLICLQKIEVKVKFIDVTPLEKLQNLCPMFSYIFCLKDGEIHLGTAPDVSEKSKQWLEATVLPQVIKWSKAPLGNNTNKVCNESLALVSQDKYYEKYNHLKLKYGKEMVKMWPECTDPTKFVYEDVAISTYLLLLWEEEKAPQTFVDIGCGNGLLVYILTMEGHNGFGVDVRKRKIWDMYPANVKLKELTITPTNIHTISHGNWIIGNHSDELTPWIPVITARMSYKCNFFLLPCCAYNFDGTKYQRHNSSKSQYMEYLEYIQKLCEEFGFETKIDRLKIPSTKRICLISRKRIYREDEYDKYCDIIQDMVNEQIGLSNRDAINNELKDFRTRDTVEKVRNCTQVDKGVTESIIKCITNYLLEECNLEVDWSRGKSAQINELVELIPSDMLKALKSECGGLQTLLRNNHQIFEVHKGCVQLRFPRTINEVKGNINSKKNGVDIKMQVKKCWFFDNHPQGCPLDRSVCSFLHEQL
ncbi:probable tRNA (uracil-O(2)-)-methyltransferase [Maniola jurtina]|uniref:probable tRNA (uracil-O(2)-)-methyltransferase n=1 Tax=Maniola jurtina TaxID=191418 RepID=UPI001E6879C0|nr:probable tRNA (uracil-O(2)-)-methyltransferase [Maniola jurtina]